MILSNYTKLFSYIIHSRILPKCTENQLRVLYYSTQSIVTPEKERAKVVNVAIIGAPNCGKSTLINKIIGRKICAASNKVQTTTKLIRAMCIEDKTQIIFLDSPGIITMKEKRKYSLPDSLMDACAKSLRCADVIGVIHDISNKWTRGAIHKDLLAILELEEQNKPKFLVLNKCDLVKKKPVLLDLIPRLTNGLIAGTPIPNVKLSKLDNGYSYFSDVFIVSAKDGDGVEDIKNYLLLNAKEANLHYAPSEWSDQRPETLIAEAVRAKLLDTNNGDIPYALKTKVDYFEEDEEQNKIICSVEVECPTERYTRVISGLNNKRLHVLKSQVTSDLVDMFRKNVALSILVTTKSKPNEDKIHVV